MALQSTFDVWLGFWMPMVRATKKLIILSDICSYRTREFLMKYRQRVAISAWVELQPRARQKISAISVLLILVSEWLMCLTVDHLLRYNETVCDVYSDKFQSFHLWVINSNLIYKDSGILTQSRMTSHVYDQESVPFASCKFRGSQIDSPSGEIN